MRFNLVDSVLEVREDHIVTVKNVTVAEEYLGDHFPGFPVLPGVMMLEAMIQAARRLISERGDMKVGPWVLGEVRNIRYGNMVRPGEQLMVRVELSKVDGDECMFKGTGLVGGETAVTGKFVLRPVRCADGVG